jgi:hypothetical protein
MPSIFSWKLADWTWRQDTARLYAIDDHLMLYEHMGAYILLSSFTILVLYNRITCISVLLNNELGLCVHSKELKNSRYYLETPTWCPWVWTFQDIGEIYQQEQDLENAAVYLSRAADLFDSEGQSSQANTMTQKIAEIYAQLEK